jgi:hypothetical protein
MMKYENLPLAYKKGKMFTICFYPYVIDNFVKPLLYPYPIWNFLKNIHT